VHSSTHACLAVWNEVARSLHVCQHPLTAVATLLTTPKHLLCVPVRLALISRAPAIILLAATHSAPNSPQPVRNSCRQFVCRVAITTSTWRTCMCFWSVCSAAVALVRQVNWRNNWTWPGRSALYGAVVRIEACHSVQLHRPEHLECRAICAHTALHSLYQSCPQTMHTTWAWNMMRLALHVEKLLVRQ